MFLNQQTIVTSELKIRRFLKKILEHRQTFRDSKKMDLDADPLGNLARLRPLVPKKDTKEVRKSKNLSSWNVDAYIKLLLMQNKYHRRELRNPGSVVFLDSFFSRVLVNSDFSSKDHAFTLERQLKRLDQDRICFFDARLVVMPLFDDNDQHWMLLTIEIEERRICCWDSYGSKFGISCWKSKCLVETFLNELWKLKYPAGDRPPVWEYSFHTGIPYQENTVDCGVFICQYAAHLLWGTSINQNVSHKRISILRELMALELLQGKVYPRI